MVSGPGPPGGVSVPGVSVPEVLWLGTVDTTAGQRMVMVQTAASGRALRVALPGMSAGRAQRNAWLDQQLQALSPEDRAIIARATALLSTIADS